MSQLSHTLRPHRVWFEPKMRLVACIQENFMRSTTSGNAAGEIWKRLMFTSAFEESPITDLFANLTLKHRLEFVRY